jgi:hypothetical protein
MKNPHRPSSLTVMGVADIILGPIAAEKGFEIGFNPVPSGDALLEVDWPGALLTDEELTTFSKAASKMLGVKVELQKILGGYDIVPVREAAPVV